MTVLQKNNHFGFYSAMLVFLCFALPAAAATPGEAKKLDLRAIAKTPPSREALDDLIKKMETAVKAGEITDIESVKILLSFKNCVTAAEKKTQLEKALKDKATDPKEAAFMRQYSKDLSKGASLMLDMQVNAVILRKQLDADVNAGKISKEAAAQKIKEAGAHTYIKIQDLRYRSLFRRQKRQLEKDVKNGKLTQAQADQRYKQVEDQGLRQLARFHLYKLVQQLTADTKAGKITDEESRKKYDEAAQRFVEKKRKEMHPAAASQPASAPKPNIARLG